MKTFFRNRGRLLALVLTIILCLLSVTPAFSASGQKKQVSRCISIVYDNSGSMYLGGNMAWSRALYAVEVFASMLNEQDELRLYPMNGIEVRGTSYTSKDPLILSGGSDISVIREIFTPSADNTPIESIEDAAEGLRSSSRDEDWLIVLTDGAEFCRENVNMSEQDTAAALSELLEDICGRDINVLYLGIGDIKYVPSFGPDPARIVTAAQSTEVLNKLTDMCGMIFGRDSLVAASGKLDFDIPMSKLIIFAQGDGLSGVDLTDASGKSVGKPTKSFSPRYSDKGAEYSEGYQLRNVTPDTSLSGYIAVYDSDLPAGSYSIHVDGTPSIVMVYYEPDVDLVVRLRDEYGTIVDPKGDLYPGSYELEYGLIDGDGNFSDSALLGKQSFQMAFLSKTEAGEEEKLIENNKRGTVPIEFKEGDVLDLEQISASYLSGYSIVREGVDLGWPKGGFQIVPRPAGLLELRSDGSADSYSLTGLEDISFPLKTIFEGTELKGDALSDVTYDVAVSGGSARAAVDIGSGSAVLSMQHAAGGSSETTPGDYTVRVTASLTDEFGVEAKSDPLEFAFAVEDDASALQIELDAKSYYVISKLDKGDPIRVYVSMDGTPLTDEQLAAATVKVEGGKVKAEAVPVMGESAFDITLDRNSVDTGKQKLAFTAQAKDELGRDISASDSKTIEFQKYPLWLRWALIALAIALLATAIFLFLNQKILPKSISVGTAGTMFSVDGETLQGYAAGCKYAGGGKKRGSLSIATPSYPGNVMVKGSINMDLEAVSPRRVKSAQRKVKVTKLAVGNTAAVQTASVTTHKLVKEEDMDGMAWLLDSKSVPGASNATDFDIGSKATCIYIGETIDGTEFSLNAKLTFK